MAEEFTGTDCVAVIPPSLQIEKMLTNNDIAQMLEAPSYEEQQLDKETLGWLGTFANVLDHSEEWLKKFKEFETFYREYKKKIKKTPTTATEVMINQAEKNVQEQAKHFNTPDIENFWNGNFKCYNPLSFIWWLICVSIKDFFLKLFKKCG